MTPAGEPWAEIDTWRSIWEALAIVRGDDPAKAVAGHRRLCQALGIEPKEEIRP